MTVVIVGARGQLGSDLVEVFSRHLGRARVVGLTRAGLDLSHDRYKVVDKLKVLEAHLVINTAAYHDVDGCELDPETAYEINAGAVARLALSCKEIGARLVHISTDMVFGQAGNGFYVESSKTGPLNVYGASKLAGEDAVRTILPYDHLIVRTSALFGKNTSPRKVNFVQAMLKKAKAGETIRVVTDYVTCPTYTRELAEAIYVIEPDVEGTVHLAGADSCSFYEFAEEIFAQTGLTPNLQSITQCDLGARARRPRSAILDSEDVDVREATAGVFSTYDVALNKYLQEVGEI